MPTPPREPTPEELALPIVPLRKPKKERWHTKRRPIDLGYDPLQPNSGPDVRNKAIIEEAAVAESVGDATRAAKEAAEAAEMAAKIEESGGKVIAPSSTKRGQPWTGQGEAAAVEEKVASLVAPHMGTGTIIGVAGLAALAIGAGIGYANWHKSRHRGSEDGKRENHMAHFSAMAATTAVVGYNVRQSLTRAVPWKDSITKSITGGLHAWGTATGVAEVLFGNSMSERLGGAAELIGGVAGEHAAHTILKLASRGKATGEGAWGLAQMALTVALQSGFSYVGRQTGAAIDRKARHTPPTIMVRHHEATPDPQIASNDSRHQPGGLRICTTHNDAPLHRRDLDRRTNHLVTQGYSYG